MISSKQPSRTVRFTESQSTQYTLVGSLVDSVAAVDPWPNRKITSDRHATILNLFSSRDSIVYWASLQDDSGTPASIRHKGLNEILTQLIRSTFHAIQCDFADAVNRCPDSLILIVIAARSWGGAAILHLQLLPPPKTPLIPSSVTMTDLPLDPYETSCELLNSRSYSKALPSNRCFLAYYSMPTGMKRIFRANARDAFLKLHSTTPGSIRLPRIFQIY